jgi:hypothetical protein
VQPATGLAQPAAEPAHLPTQQPARCAAEPGCVPVVSAWLLEQDPQLRQVCTEDGLVPVRHALGRFSNGMTLLHLVGEELRATIRHELQNPLGPNSRRIPMDAILELPGLEQLVNVTATGGHLSGRAPLVQVITLKGGSHGLEQLCCTFVEWLIARGADVNTLGGQPLALAVSAGSVWAAQCLCEARADVGLAERATGHGHRGRPTSLMGRAQLLPGRCRQAMEQVLLAAGARTARPPSPPPAERVGGQVPPPPPRPPSPPPTEPVGGPVPPPPPRTEYAGVAGPSELPPTAQQAQLELVEPRQPPQPEWPTAQQAQLVEPPRPPPAVPARPAACPEWAWSEWSWSEPHRAWLLAPPEDRRRLGAAWAYDAARNTWVYYWPH